MITWILIGIAAYLLVGCITMLVVNELLDCCLTRKEFLRGMLLWPYGAIGFLAFFFSAVLGRIRG